MSEAEEKSVIMPGLGEVITSLSSRNTFTVGTEIGEGAFGKVFNCRDSWDNSLAMKVFKPTGGSYEEVRAAAVSELGRLLTLRHPNITYVFDAFEYRSTFHIVTELCDFSLTQLFELENFDPTIWLMPIARCLLQAVDYLHRNGFAHQDIHPSNIFGAFPRDELGVDMAGSSRPIVFKLGDLGLSAAFGDMAPHSKRALWILPPECIDQASYGPIDHRQDLYHVGLVLLQLAIGRPMRWNDAERLAGAPRELALTLPPPLNTAIEKALRRRVPFRTASAMEMWRDLHALE